MQAPYVPVLIDGKLYQPHEISRFNGTDLHFILDEVSIKQGLLKGFTSEAQRDKYVRTVYGMEPRNGPQATNRVQPTACYSYSYFFDYSYYAGSYLGVYIGYGVPDLRYYGWNDRISSVWATCLGYATTLYEHLSYTGSSIWIAPGINVADLGWYGWSNRATSLIVWW